jgi:hypothetical protein
MMASRPTNPRPNTTIHSNKRLQGFKGYVEIIVRNILELQPTLRTRPH